VAQTSLRTLPDIEAPRRWDTLSRMYDFLLVYCSDFRSRGTAVELYRVSPKSEPLNILQQRPQICSDLNKILHTQDDICYKHYYVRYDMRCYFNVRSKADISRLNLPHGNDN